MKKILLSFMLVFVFSTVIRADTFEFVTDVVEAITDTIDESADEPVSETTDKSLSPEEKITPLVGQYIIDGASLLTDRQLEKLEVKSAEINKKYNFDAIILTVYNMGNLTPMEYSSNFFHNNYNEDGVVFLVSMEERDYDISTFSYGKEVFTDDYGLDYIIDNVVPSLSDGNYNKSFSEFLSYVEDFVSEAKSKTPYGTDNKYFQKNKIMAFITIAAFLISVLVIIFMVFSMNTKKPENLAHDYMNRESVNMTERNDVFLYRTVSKTARPKEDSSSGRSGNSRSGGRSGKF